MSRISATLVETVSSSASSMVQTMASARLAQVLPSAPQSTTVLSLLSSTSLSCALSVATGTMPFSVVPVAGLHQSSSWPATAGRALLALLNFVTSVLYQVLKWIAIYTPAWLYNVLSTNVTVTMNATTFIVIICVVASAMTWVIQYRYLNMYSFLPPEPQRKEPQVDLFPDVHGTGTKPGMTNYLDEFLSAIKIFGYLERPVFHELTRSMQTKKLIAGETFDMEEEKGYCIVVDGLMEIFVKSPRDSSIDSHNPVRKESEPATVNDLDTEDPLAVHKYQLLTEVGNGVSMSSLFSIMSLFTEDINLRKPDDESPEPLTADEDLPSSRFSHHKAFMRSEESLPLPTPLVESDSQFALHLRSHNNRPLLLEAPKRKHTSSKTRPPTRRMNTSSVHPDLVARATVDTTIAIIPASAFRRLIKTYPKATAHIVHVILSRFQRVTLATAHKYLGLRGDMHETELRLIKHSMCRLPNFLRGDALDRLKIKFKRELERIGSDEGGKGIALHNANVPHLRHRSSTRLHKGALYATGSHPRHASVVGSIIVPPGPRVSIHTPGPGDLLTNTSTPRLSSKRSMAIHAEPSPMSLSSQTLNLQDNSYKESQTPLGHGTFNPFNNMNQTRLPMDGRDTMSEDDTFRECILQCIFKAIGLTSSRDNDSKDSSPTISPYDRRQKQNSTHAANAFGIMGPLDDDNESVTSAGLQPHVSLNEHTLASDMKNEVEIVYFPAGMTLVEEGERSPGLYYVIDGFLDVCVAATNDGQGEPILDPLKRGAKNPVSMPRNDRAKNKDHSKSKGGTVQEDNAPRVNLGLIKPGELVGYIGSMSTYRSFIDVVAKTDVYVGFLPRAVLERIVERFPIVLLTMAKRITSLLPRLISYIDFALEWVQVNSGEVIFHKGDESDAIYLVLNGRLRLIKDKEDGGVKVVAEFGQGDSVGELEVLTESAREGTLHAIRDTELVKFPRTLFNSLAREHPNITIKISKIIASRMRALVEATTKPTGNDSSGNQANSTLNLRTVAVLPINSVVPVVEFGNRLMSALAQVSPPNGATSLNQAVILNHLGKHAFNKMGKLKLSQYLADLEEKYGLVVYIADTNVTSPWTQTCITQADCILLVGLAEGSPEIGEYERFLLGMKSTARKILVLLHAERYSPPGLTRRWLKNRMWVNGGHYHIQMQFRNETVPVHPPLRRLGTVFKESVQIIQAEIQKYRGKGNHGTSFYVPEAPFKGDFHRLARRLCGRSIGLVLGGGGARGIAQVGVIRALEDAGIPVDVVGGTSIGALIGALYARHADVVPIFGLAKKFAGRMSSIWRFALDLTYPTSSYTTGHVFNRGIFKSLGTTQIEDFWLEYYCNTTNISKSRPEYHTSGYAWRYVRASMSLAGLLPPLCDEGCMLLDGGYIDNLTVSHMKSMGVDTIFAVDVGALDDDTPQSFGDALSGFWSFFNRWNPFSSIPNPPTLAEIQARLAYVASVDALVRAKQMPGCYYMRPPIDGYATLDFGKFDEIYQVGYKYGKEFIQALREKGELPVAAETEAKKALRRTMAPRRASI